MGDSSDRAEALKLVAEAIRSTQDGREPADVERYLNGALELDPEGIAALEEAAHFYVAVMPNPEQARKYATACRNRAAQIISEMDEILAKSGSTSQSATLKSRLIGGIIGPY